jgi:Flp pilus assembly pilin Flp
MSGRPPVAKKRQVPEIRMNRMNDRETMSMLKKWKENKLVSEWNAFWRQEEGVGVIEVVLILVVLIGLVIIFKTQITKLLENIFKEIESQSKEVY